MRTNNISKTDFKGTFLETQQMRKAINNANPYELLKFQLAFEDMGKINDKKSFCLDFIKEQLSLIVYKNKKTEKTIPLKDLPENHEIIEDDFYTGIITKVQQILRSFYPKIRDKKEDEIIDSYAKFPVSDFGQYEAEEQVIERILPVHEDLAPFYEASRDAELFDKHEDLKEIHYYPVYDKNDVPLAEIIRPHNEDAFYYNQNTMERQIDVLEEEIKKPRPKENELPKNFPSFALDHVREFSLAEANEVYSLLKERSVINFDECIASCAKMLKKYSLQTTILRIHDALLLKLSNKEVTEFCPDLLKFLIKHPEYRKSVVYRDTKHGYGGEFFSLQLAGAFEEQWQKGILENSLNGAAADKTEKVASEAAKPVVEESKKILIPEPQKKLPKVYPGVGVFVDMNNIDEELLDFMTDYPDYIDCVVSRNGRSKQVFDKYGARIFRKLADIYSDPARAKDIYVIGQERIWGGRFNACTLVDEKAEILPSLLERGYSEKDVLKIYDEAKYYDIENVSELIQACIKYRDTVSAGKICKMVKQSIVKPLRKKKFVFNPDCMESLIREERLRG